MLNISRDNAFQIYQDYLDYRYPLVQFEGEAIRVSVIVVRSFAERTQDAMLDRWLYQEEVAGRVMVSQDGLTIGVTKEGRKVYEMVSPYFVREFANV